jgi:hypothetical protein
MSTSDFGMHRAQTSLEPLGHAQIVQLWTASGSSALLFKPPIPADTGRFQLLTAVSVLAGKHSLSRPTRSSLSCRAPANAACAARSHRAPGAYYRHMGRIIGTILGAILAMWLIFTAIGWFSAMLKTFIITALIAAVVFIVVWLLAGRRRQD